jgi:hypothetical protein
MINMAGIFGRCEVCRKKVELGVNGVGYITNPYETALNDKRMLCDKHGHIKRDKEGYIISDRDGKVEFEKT